MAQCKWRHHRALPLELHRRESKLVIDQVATEFAKNHAGEDVCLISIHDCLVTTDKHKEDVQGRLEKALRDELNFDVPVKIEPIS